MCWRVESFPMLRNPTQANRGRDYRWARSWHAHLSVLSHVWKMRGESPAMRAGLCVADDAHVGWCWFFHLDRL